MLIDKLLIGSLGYHSTIDKTYQQLLTNKIWNLTKKELYVRPLTSMKKECKTRWSSTHGMGESLVKVQENGSKLVSSRLRSISMWLAVWFCHSSTRAWRTLENVIVLSSPGLVLETHGVSFLCHQPMNPSNQISQLLWRQTLPHIVETRGSRFSCNGI